ncbi:hypothetical protein AAZX31_17G245700 [Glycine max]
MLDPNTSRTLRIYPLENITRCDSSVDVEPGRIRLLSNRYTTNTLLDTVNAATIQYWQIVFVSQSQIHSSTRLPFKEMGGSRRPSESLRTNEQPTEKKRGFGDWMNLIKPADEEKDHWHHCRNCGDIFCDKCTRGRIALTSDEDALQVRVCDRCMAEVTLRLSNAKESSSKPVLQSHEDLAKKLQNFG